MENNFKFEAVKKVADVNFKVKDLSKISRIDTISPPSVFVGSKLKYPLVNVGILSPLEKDEEAWVYDAPKQWAENNLEVRDVVKLRNSLLNSRFQTKVQDVRLNKKFVEIAKDLAVSSKQVDVEIQLKDRVIIGRDKDRVLTPHGMKAQLKHAEITGNVKIERSIDKVINDEIKAVQGIEILYNKEVNEYSLSKILSVGVMGMKKDKKLVPTRWSITATDDMLGKYLLNKIRDYKWIENYELFFGEFMGNQYMILIFPNNWSYELLEMYLPGSSWNPSQEIKASTDMESYKGRKNYAFNTAGGYYAARLPILEYLNKIKRQASVIALRIETPTYWAALGVWVVRESVRKALENKMKFDSREELIESVKKIGRIKYRFDFANVLNQSKILREIKTKRSLQEWM
jgi:DNA repair protein NreA